MRAGFHIHPYNYLILWIGMLVYSGLKAQTTVASSEYLVETRKDTYHWTINGLSFSPSMQSTEFFPHDSGCDTIIFSDAAHPGSDTIYSRIPAGRRYQMIIGCCDAGFDIYEESRLNRVFFEMGRDSLHPLAYDSIFLSLKEPGLVGFTILNMKPHDTLIAMYIDFSGNMAGRMITKSGEYSWTGIDKGYYSTSNDFVILARKKPGLTYTKLPDGMISWESPELAPYFDILKKIHVRIFSGDRLRVSFDAQTYKTTLKFEDSR